MFSVYRHYQLEVRVLFKVVIHQLDLLDPVPHHLQHIVHKTGHSNMIKDCGLMRRPPMRNSIIASHQYSAAPHIVIAPALAAPEKSGQSP